MAIINLTLTLLLKPLSIPLECVSDRNAFDLLIVKKEAFYATRKRNCSNP